MTAETKLEEARERLGRERDLVRRMYEATPKQRRLADLDDMLVSVNYGSLTTILAELDRRSPPTREGAWVLVPREPSEAMLDQGVAVMEQPGKDSPWHVWAAMLAAAPPPPDVSRGLDREEVAAIPADLLERILAVGKVEWGAVGARPDTRHLQDFANTLQITREEFGLGEEQALQGVYLEGTATVLCHTGTSPNSGQHARILVGAWNRLHDIALCSQSRTLDEPESAAGAWKPGLGPANCQRVLMWEASKPYPRTCERCGLGPCPFWNNDRTEARHDGGKEP